MPLQRFGSAPVARPPGLVAPAPVLRGITEIRLHGVGGTQPADLLGDAAPQLVSGDRIAGFYRTADLPAHVAAGVDVPERHVEAYSWGGLTSRSGSRVLWVLLLPFALANVAGWMCSPLTHRSRVLFFLHRTTVRWAALGVTVNFLLITAMTGMDLFAYQCGARPSCANSLWWPLNLIGAEPLASHLGARLFVGALLPIAIVVGFALLTLRSITRYEDVRPPFRTGSAGSSGVDGADASVGSSGSSGSPGATGSPGSAGSTGFTGSTGSTGSSASSGVDGGAHRPGKDRRGGGKRTTRSAAARGKGLDDHHFWDGRASTFDLGCLHVACSLALIAMLLAHTVRATSPSAVTDTVDSRLWIAVLVSGGLAVAGSLIGLMCNAYRVVAPSLVVFAGVAVVCASWLALAQPAVTGPAGPLPGMQGAAGWAYRAIFASAGLVLVPTVLGGWRRKTFFVFGPFVALALGLIVLNVVLLGVIVRVGELIAPVPVELNTADVAPVTTEITVYDAIGGMTPYLTLVPLLLVILFVLVEFVVYWLAGRRAAKRSEVRAAYQGTAASSDEPAWFYNTAAADRRNGWTRRRKVADWMFGRDWDARIVRARRFALVPRDVDTLLTLMALTGVAFVAGVPPRDRLLASLPHWLSWLPTAGAWLAAAIPVVVIVLLRNGWRSLDSRRHIGVVWDVTTFWPRAYHPLAPPSYAERAVPELQRRLWRIHDAGGRVVLAAHSQGSIIAAAALLQRRGRPDGLPGPRVDHVAMVTFGSPLRTLYHWGFPAYFNDDALSKLLPGTSDVGLAGWRNYHYQTDYIGGAVFSRQAAGNNVDVELPDPVTSWYVYGQPEPVPGRHSGYWNDPAVWSEVDAFSRVVAVEPHLAGHRPPQQARSVEDWP